MNCTHSTRHVLSAVAFAAFALSALPAAAADKEYALKVTAVPSVGNGVALTAVFRNTSPGGGASSNIKSLRLKAPPGVTFPTGTLQTLTPSYCAVYAADEIRCENLASPIAKNQEFTLQAKANIGAGTCSSLFNDGQSDDVNTGSQYAVGNWFDLVFNASFPGSSGFTASLAAGGSPKLTLSAPTSLAWNTTSTITATVTDACGAPVTTTTLSATATGTGVDLSPTSDSVSPFEFSLSVTGGRSATITVNSSNPALQESLTFPVYAGSQNCAAIDFNDANDVPPGSTDVGYFSATVAGGVPLSGTVVGFRAQNDKAGDNCELVNYTFTNNVKVTAGSTIDGEGKTIPRNWVSLVWDRTYQPNAVWAYYATFLPNWGNATTGLPVAGEVFFCNEGATDCTVDGNRTQMKPCVDIALKGSSIPGTDPVCILEKTWLVVPIAECTAARGSTGATAYCHKPTIRVLDARDPPWGMTDE